MRFSAFTLFSNMNPSVRIQEKKLLSDNWYKLWRYTYDFQVQPEVWETHQREVYDRGNGATILLYHPERNTVVLTRQFRMATLVNGNSEGYLIEACAGLLDEENPEQAIIRETEEETGYRISEVEKVFEIYMSPGSVSEILYFFIARYSDEMKTGKGGGIEAEQEKIEVLEIPFPEALAMVKSGAIKDAKTILLLQHVLLQGLLKA